MATEIDTTETELIGKLQDLLGLSEAVASNIVQMALFDYIKAIAEDCANDRLDREFNRGKYRG